MTDAHPHYLNTGHAIADTVLSSGFTGLLLADLLQQRFPAATRYEVFLAFGFVAADCAAGAVIDKAEVIELQRELRELRQATMRLPAVAA